MKRISEEPSRLILIIELLVLPYVKAQVCFSEPDNLAYQKTVVQSSTYGSFVGSLGVDGDRLDILNHGGAHCPKTGYQAYPWLVIDLGQSTDVSTVIVVNARGGDGTRARNVNVDIGDEFDSASFAVLNSGFGKCGQQALIENGEIYYFHCAQTKHGRYVVVYLKKTNYLNLCEIEVFSTQVFPEEPWLCIWPDLMGPSSHFNIAEGKPVYSSSPYQSANKAVDGSSYYYWQSCFRNLDGPQWLVVDLGSVQTVIAVALTNSNAYDGRLADFTVWVGNNEGPSTPFDSSLFDVCVKMCKRQSDKRKYYVCDNPKEGRHVAVERHSTSHFYLCELEVYTNEIYDLEYPTVEPEYNGWNMGKYNVFDNNDSTCVDIGQRMYNRRHITFILEWHTGSYDATNKAESTLHCRPTFYVNITHSPGFKGVTYMDGTDMNIPSEDGTLRSYTVCPLFGHWKDGNDMEHSKFKCTCTADCTVYAGVYKTHNYDGEMKLCGIYLYN